MKMLLVFVILVHGSLFALSVEVYEGTESVLLPCYYAGSIPDDPMVTWSRYDLNPKIVHIRQEEDDLKDQNHHYSGRTSMMVDALDTGDFGLVLRKPQLSDSGTYTCIISDGRMEHRLTDVHLWVKERFPSWLIVLLVLLPVLLIVATSLLVYFRHYFMSAYEVRVDSGVESVLLPCKTTVHLPEDVKVEWTDSYKWKVHVYCMGSDQPQEQDWLYQERTQMKRNLLKTGDLSLTLRFPTDRDNDTFLCTVYSSKGTVLMQKQVELLVRVQQVKVDSGVESVEIPCQATVDLPEDVIVEWMDSDIFKVHVSKNGSDPSHDGVDDFYRGRTEMKRDFLKTGDLSLTLKYPTERDRITYTCTVYSSDRKILMKQNVKLRVKVCRVEVVEGVKSVQLPFKTTGDLPEDVILWWWRDQPEFMTVYGYQKNSDLSYNCASSYRDRAEMNEDSIQTGDLSLTLNNPTARDTGMYRCRVMRQGNIVRVKIVLLKVRATSH